MPKMTVRQAVESCDPVKWLDICLVNCKCLKSNIMLPVIQYFHDSLTHEWYFSHCFADLQETCNLSLLLTKVKMLLKPLKVDKTFESLKSINCCCITCCYISFSVLLQIVVEKCCNMSLCRFFRFCILRHNGHF